MTHITLKLGDEIRAGDFFEDYDGKLRPVSGMIGSKVSDAMAYKYVRPAPDQPQEATEMPETDAYASSLDTLSEYLFQPHLPFAHSLELRLHAQTARADRLAVALELCRKTFTSKCEGQHSWPKTEIDTALASEGPTLAMAEEVAQARASENRALDFCIGLTGRNPDDIRAAFKERDAALAATPTEPTKE